MIQQQALTGEPIALPPPAKTDRQTDGLSRHILAGYVLIGTMLALIFGWMANTSLAGAVVGAGKVVVQSDEKLVQHPTGGVVGHIYVQEGATVKEGDLLLRMDDTAVRANLDILEGDLSTLKARLARLKAERDGAKDIAFPDDMRLKPTDADRDSMHTETQVFHARREALANHKNQLTQRISQLREQVKGNALLLESRGKELKLIGDALVTSKAMLDKQLATRTQGIQYAQTVARLEGDYGNLIAENGRLKAQISETEFQRSGLEDEMRADILKELRDTEAKIAEDLSRRINARDQLSRVEIRAPATGLVHEMVVHTVGGVVNAGETIMKIVPDHLPLLMEVRINPTDIDQIHVGQKAVLKFPAFNRAKTPEINGTIILVGADASIDRQTGRGYYEVRIAPEADMGDKLAKLGITLVPGMPAEAFMETDERTTLSYLLKPVTDQIAHAFREE